MPNSKSSTFQIILLVVFGVCAVAGVLIFALLVGGGSGSGNGAVTIWGTLEEGVVKELIQQASDNDPKFRSVTYVRKDPDTYETVLTEALASGKGPDLFFVRSDYAYRDAGKALPVLYEAFPITQYKSTFIDAANAFLMLNGIMAVPIVVDPLVMYWNRDLLASDGYATAPKTWTEVQPMAQTITNCNKVAAPTPIVGCDDAHNIRKATINLGGSVNNKNAKDILSLLILQAGGTITARNDAGSLSSTLSPRNSDVSSVNAVKYYTQFGDPSQDHYTWSRALPEARTAFAQGDLALYIGYASEMPMIAAANPNLNFAVTGVPQLKTIDQAKTFAHVYGLAVARTSRNPTGARAIAYAMADDSFSGKLGTQLAITSPLRRYLAIPVTGTQELINKQALIADTWIDPDPLTTEPLFRAMIEDTASGAAEVTVLIQKANNQMNQAIANLNN